MNFNLTELPERMRTTPLQLKLIEIVHISHDKPEIKEKLMEALQMVEQLKDAATDWKTVFFKIANGIN